MGGAHSNGVVGIVVYGYLAMPGWVGVADKTLWDWMQLLIVSLLLAGGWFLLNRRAAQYTEDAQRQRAEMTEIRHELHDTLRAYFDQMNRLIIDGHLFEKPADSREWRLVQVWTRETLSSLDMDQRRRPLVEAEE